MKYRVAQVHHSIIFSVAAQVWHILRLLPSSSSTSPSSRDLRSQAEWAFTRPKSNDFFLDSRNNYTMGNKVSAAYKRHSDAKSGHKKKPVSPVPSHPSSLTSQESNSNASDIIRHGRKFHNFSESTYWLPNDEEEMDRLVGVSCVPQSSQ